eukprot:TRINITY_DN8329_c0_g2_i1.p1 TRINITY_DN8329_c0_g2~~TRINITY_DN8329_c0_g2_i1.p1  ORF type:complete len:846 (+),score=168.22 TRINITY_DN8329_c0_g2_i1:104-2641(+)
MAITSKTVIFQGLLLCLLFHIFSPVVLNAVGETPYGILDTTRIAENLPVWRFGVLVKPILQWLATRFQGYEDISGNYTVSGITGNVEIITDVNGVPHIYGPTAPDTVFGLGYVHARDRLWQIYFSHYICKGQLSELFGEMALQSDVFLRLMKFYARSPDWQINMDKEQVELVKSYTRGLNAYQNSPDFQLPLEFTILSVPLRNITDEDVVCHSLLVGWQMTKGWNHEITRGLLQKALGEKFHELEVHYPETNPTIISKPYEWNLVGENWVDSVSPYIPQVAGSNSWTVSGIHTKSGNPILCNDPHVPLQAPSFWFETHLSSADGKLNAAGVSQAGLPGVTIGHNGVISWGYTLSFVDTEDLILEKINPANSSQYEFQGEWKDMTVVEEEFKIKGAAPQKIQLKWTRNGPLISEPLGLELPVAQRSIILTSDASSVTGLAMICQAKTYEEASEIWKNVKVPLNAVFADNKGNIGYRATGSSPIRSKGYLGDVPVPGWTGENEWIGFVPAGEMPHGFNPKKGYYVTANNKVINSSFPYYLGSNWISGYRAARIEEIISEKVTVGEKFSIEELREIQMDVKSLAALEFIRACQKHSEAVFEKLKKNEEATRAFKTLLEWDGFLTTDSVAASIYHSTRFYSTYALLLKTIGEKSTQDFLGTGVHPTLAHPSEWVTYHMVSLIRLFNNDSSILMKEAGGHAHVLSTGIEAAVGWLKRELGSEPKNWAWGNIHTAVGAHVLGALPILDQVFNVGPFPIGGDADTPMNTPVNPSKPYSSQGWSTHYRQCFDMNDIDNARIIQFPGNSGNYGSKHYDDMVDDWKSGKTHRLLWKREDVEKNKETTVILTPKAI